MGILERKEREKKQRRKMIIDAAERVFLKYGFEETTMKDIADESELSKGTLYLYFKNKNELCLAIYNRGLINITNKFKKLFASDKTTIDKITEIPIVFFDYIEKYPEYYNAFMNFRSHGKHCNNSSKRLEACLIKNTKINEMLSALIEDGKEKGLIKEETDSDKISNLIWNNQTGVLSNSVLINSEAPENYPIETKEIIIYFFKLIIDAISK